MTVTEAKDGPFLLSTDPARLQVDRIHRYLAYESYWCVEIPKHIVQKAIDHSLCFGIYDESKPDHPQVAYARVVTDYATFAWICDVYVEKEYRGKGLSKWMMRQLVDHPDLKGLRRLCLATVAAHKLYEKVGFTVTQTPGSWMEIKDNDIYKKMQTRQT
ncbi:MAG: GNAT family N-acetyltransferase [Bdellovibrionales bacterium]|nr:GNAT family N-acetyltransferase [Bdellovibrionales bacterium]